MPSINAEDRVLPLARGKKKIGRPRGMRRMINDALQEAVEADGRTITSKYIKTLEANLLLQLGKPPTTTQQMMIREVAISCLFLRAISSFVLRLDAGFITDEDGVRAVVMQREVILRTMLNLLGKLGLIAPGAEQEPESLHSYLRGKR